jgi:hypothetical protein
MAEYPLVFTFQDAVSGNGFLAGVTVSGQALIAKEDDQWWMLGVRPAALASKGETPPAAYIEFRKSFTAVLFDAASQAATFEDFKAEVERFFYERDEAEERRWQAAGDAIREGRVTPEPPFSELKRESPSERPTALSVERLDKQLTFTASDNVLDSYALSTAA